MLSPPFSKISLIIDIQAFPHSPFTDSSILYDISTDLEWIDIWPVCIPFITFRVSFWPVVLAGSEIKCLVADRRSEVTFDDGERHIL